MAPYYEQNDVPAVPRWAGFTGIQGLAPRSWSASCPLHRFLLPPLRWSSVYSALALGRLPWLCSKHSFLSSVRSILPPPPSRLCQNSSHSSIAPPLGSRPTAFKQAARFSLLHSMYHRILHGACHRQVLFQLLIDVSDTTT